MRFPGGIVLPRGVVGHYDLHQLCFAKIKPWLDDDVEEVIFHIKLMEQFLKENNISVLAWRYASRESFLLKIATEEEIRIEVEKILDQHMETSIKEPLD